MEMYLKTILGLEAVGPPRVKAIADALRVTMPSVSGALRLLKEEGLVLHKTYGVVRLSARGRRAAQEVDRRYEILRRFFIDVLSVDEKAAGRDACAIEHVMGPDTLSRLTAFLDYTTRCRLDVGRVIDHFHEYLAWRLAGDHCRECEVAPTRRGDCPLPRARGVRRR
jgi:DtxR family Mn-dependent transcriptional regulator